MVLLLAAGICVVLPVANITAFCLMGVDKRRAKLRAAGASEKKVRRIPEATLLLWAACFGGIGATLGMCLFRHKTRHWYFRIGLPVMAAVQVVLLVLAWHWMVDFIRNLVPISPPPLRL